MLKMASSLAFYQENLGKMATLWDVRLGCHRPGKVKEPGGGGVVVAHRCRGGTPRALLGRPEQKGGQAPRGG